MDVSNAMYVRRSVKNTATGKVYVYENIELYRTVEQIITEAQAKSDRNSTTQIEEVRPAKSTDKIRCGFCGVETPLSKVLVKDYWSNGRRQQGMFCSSECHSFCQMGAEG